MIRTPNWKDIALNKQCGVCAHYQQFIKNGVRTARGKCKLRNAYKQRTDKCMKYDAAKEVG